MKTKQLETKYSIIRTVFSAKYCSMTRFPAVVTICFDKEASKRKLKCRILGFFKINRNDEFENCFIQSLRNFEICFKWLRGYHGRFITIQAQNQIQVGLSVTISDGLFYTKHCYIG